MTQIRMKAALITPRNTLLLLQRDKPFTPTYYVFPGGGVELTDASWMDALHRELNEEIGTNDAAIAYEIYKEDTPVGLQFFHIGTVTHYDGVFTGPEFANEANGIYTLVEVELKEAVLDTHDIYPREAFLAVLSEVERRAKHPPTSLLTVT